MSNIVAYKSNWLIEASYKLTLQEQRFLLCCIGKLNPDSTNKKMTVTAMEFYNCFFMIVNIQEVTTTTHMLDPLGPSNLVLETKCTSKLIQEKFISLDIIGHISMGS